VKTSLTITELTDYVCRQVNHFFPDEKVVRPGQIKNDVGIALQRTDNCFSHFALPHYYTGSESVFNHLFSDQYATFLWFLSNTLWQTHGRAPVLDKVYSLNKALHGLDCMYDTRLPDIFFLAHCIGTVLGKASYANFFVALQGCTIGAHNEKYPVLGIGVALAAHASIVGGCTIGNRVSIGSNTDIFQHDVPDDAAVYRNDEGVIVYRAATVPYAQRFFRADLRQITTDTFPAFFEG
jgi:serine O-acetyltransferase